MLGHTVVKMGIVMACLAGVAAPATAQVISIRHGTLVFELDKGGALDISGNRRFKLEATASTSGRFDAINQCRDPECAPGTIVEIGAVWVGLDLPGTARLQGQTYGDVGGFDSPNSAGIEISGKVTMPAMSDGPVSVTVPFDLTGVFLYGDGGQGSQDAFLSGGGDVTLFLEPYPGENSWQIRSAAFEFRPVKRP
jgi:hypothetical protein